MHTEAKPKSKVWEEPIVEVVYFSPTDIICTSGIDAPTRDESGTGDKSTWDDLFGDEP